MYRSSCMHGHFLWQIFSLNINHIKYQKLILNHFFIPTKLLMWLPLSEDFALLSRLRFFKPNCIQEFPENSNQSLQKLCALRMSLNWKWMRTDTNLNFTARVKSVQLYRKIQRYKRTFLHGKKKHKPKRLCQTERIADKNIVRFSYLFLENGGALKLVIHWRLWMVFKVIWLIFLFLMKIM